MTPTRQHIYVVRVWLEQDSHGGVWRASVLDPRTGERHYFAGAASLSAYLGHLMPVGTVRDTSPPRDR